MKEARARFLFGHVEGRPPPSGREQGRTVWTHNVWNTLNKKTSRWLGRAAVSSSQQHLPPTKCFFTLISNSKMYKAHLAFHFITINIQQERQIVKWISNEFREDPGIILRNRETFSFSILPSLYKVESIILEWLQSMYIELIKYLNNRRYDLIILYNWKILHSVEFSGEVYQSNLTSHRFATRSWRVWPT